MPTPSVTPLNERPQLDGKHNYGESSLLQHLKMASTFWGNTFEGRGALSGGRHCTSESGRDSESRTKSVPPPEKQSIYKEWNDYKMNGQAHL
jgi:hypothetical protein